MKVRTKADNRSEIDKRYDSIYNKMVRDAHLTAKQKYIVSNYTTKVIGEKVREVENAMNMGFWIGLIEVEHYGCNKRAIKLPRLQNYVREVVNEAYGKDCIDANGHVCYDGCGLEHLKTHLARHGVEFVDE